MKKHFASVEEFIERAIEALDKPGYTLTANSPAKDTVFEQGLGLFGSPEDSALLDEVVAMAYEERRRPSKRNYSRVKWIIR